MGRHSSSWITYFHGRGQIQTLTVLIATSQPNSMASSMPQSAPINSLGDIPSLLLRCNSMAAVEPLQNWRVLYQAVRHNMGLRIQWSSTLPVSSPQSLLPADKAKGEKQWGKSQLRALRKKPRFLLLGVQEDQTTDPDYCNHQNSNLLREVGIPQGRSS